MLLVDGKRKTDLPKLAKAVKFELLQATYEDNRVVDGSGKKHIRKNLIYRIPTVYSKFDKALNQNVEYRYAVHEIPIKTGKDEGQKRYSPDKIVFTSTTLVCTTDQPDLYEFLKNAPWLEAEGNQRPIYRELNPVADSQTRLEREALRTKAKRLVLDEDALPEITLRRILSTTGQDATADISVIKDKLLDLAELDPKAFLKMVGSKDTELKALIMELTQKRFIAYDSVKRQWTWGEKTNDNGNTIVATPQGKSEMDWLIDTLLREEALLKSFKLLSNDKTKEEDPNKTDERKKLEEKAKKVKCHVGMHFMEDAKLKTKIENTIKSLKEDFDNVKTKDERKSEIEKMLADVGELVLVNK